MALSSNESYIEENILKIRDQISHSAKASGRGEQDITLIAVTKNFPANTIANAQNCGINSFGENRVQEMLLKMPSFENIDWHMIGHLQTNKVKQVVGRTTLIHSVDSVKLLNEIDSCCEDAGIVSDILLEINIAKEESKYGFLKEEVYRVLEIAAGKKHIFVKGLMTVAPLVNNNNTNSLHFNDMHNLYLDIKEKMYNNNIEMNYLSMGMSGDFCDAILAGANMVRIGSAIFGDR